MFEIFEIFGEIPEDYRHIIGFWGDEIFEILEMLGTAQELWGLWDVRSRYPEFGTANREPTSGGRGLVRRMQPVRAARPA